MPDKKYKKSPRREGREIALQFLYANEFTTKINAQKPSEQTEIADSIAKSNFWQIHISHSKSAEIFAREIITNTIKNLKEIDNLISEILLKGSYKLTKISLIEKSLLRIAVSELLYGEDVNARIVINEAIEIAKRFGSSESSRFINGVLDNIAKKI